MSGYRATFRRQEAGHFHLGWSTGLFTQTQTLSHYFSTYLYHNISIICIAAAFSLSFYDTYIHSFHPIFTKLGGKLYLDNN